jgi:S-adenosylmethionine:tRNA ribosyltransferase-isomerase
MSTKDLAPLALPHPALEGFRALDFTLPPELEAGEPPEARGMARDQVRLMVTYRSDDRLEHTSFRELTRFLQSGDVLVINTSGTVNAALNVTRADGTSLELHLSTHLPADLWIVETRLPAEPGTKPFFELEPGEVLTLPGFGAATILVPYLHSQGVTQHGPTRLWVASLSLPEPLHDYLNRYGFPIRYPYVHARWPLSYYQTVYATEPGSAEMPSAGRAFTADLLNRLVAQGVQLAPLILHTGVASLEADEPPYEEYYHVPLETARWVNEAHATHQRVIAVGTTVIRALETVTDQEGNVHPGEGLTDLVVTPQRGIRAADGLLTGFHEPRATHLAMLEALASHAHLQVAYNAALAEKYLWHEFGDLHLLLP